VKSKYFTFEVSQKILQFFKLLLEAHIIFSLLHINLSSLQHIFPTEKKVRKTELEAEVHSSQETSLVLHEKFEV